MKIAFELYYYRILLSFYLVNIDSFFSWDAEGMITAFTLTPANGSEREAVWYVIGGIRGLLIGDKGYISGELGKQLQRNDLNLQTPKQSNIKDQQEQSLG